MVKLEKECGTRCRSRSHAGELVCAVTKATLRQAQLFLLTCSNPTGITDGYHRSVLHMAASCGKWKLIQWLIEELGMETTGKDSESGWTALHRALFYGQLTSARLLIQHAGNLQTRDREGLSPLDLVMKDRLPYVDFVQSGLQEVYTWGDNSNFTLGHENEQRRRQPEMIDSFRKKGVSIKQVVMSKYHTVFVSTSGQVFTCGHGRGGRLGHGTEQTCLEPRLVEAVHHEVCVCVAAARDHTLMLMESGSVYSCGLNDCNQLGQIPPAPCSLAPKQMNSKMLKSRALKGIACNRFHSVLYTTDSVFTFGLNAGQLGHLKVSGEKMVTHPRQVSALNHKEVAVLWVTCSDAATVVYTSKGDVYVLHEYLCRKVVSRWLGLTEIRVIGGHLDHKMDESLLRERGGSELVIAMLNSSGKVYLWRALDPIAKRCAWSTKRSLHITNLALTLHSLVFITQDGDGFTAALPKAKPKDKMERLAEPSHQTTLEKFPVSLSDLIARDEVVDVSIEKMPAVHRATAVTSDRKGRNYAVLQCQPNACLTEIPQVSCSEMTAHLERLLSEAETSDVIHDCVLRVNEHSIPVHKYILSCRSDYFRKIFIENTSISSEDKAAVIDIDNENWEIFRQMLMYIYSDSCDILTVGKKLEFTTLNVNSHVNKTAESCKNTVIDDVDRNEKSSAFEVREKQKKKSKSKKGSKKGAGLNGMMGAGLNGLKGVSDSGGGVSVVTQSSKNPVTRLQELGRSFGVKSLTKRLEAVKCQGGVIQTVSGRHLPSPSIRFTRRTYPSLYDVTLKCSDGVLLQAHRCVLVGRLEYFRSMLASGWIETSMDQPLTLPVPGDVMSAVLDYLYTDSSVEIDGCEDIEFLCNVLVVADQLLIPRLRELCETRIASEISLKNAAELLEVSSFYNAVQLKETCQQFVCLNLAALIETHSLDVLSEEVMEELTEYYRHMIPGMDHRHITPYPNWPSIQHLEQLESRYSGSEVKPWAGDTDPARKVKAKKRRGRTKSSGEEVTLSQRGDRKTSVCSVNSELDSTLEQEEVTEELSPWIPSHGQHNDGKSEATVPDSTLVQPVSISTLVSRLPRFTNEWPRQPIKREPTSSTNSAAKTQVISGYQGNQRAEDVASASGDACATNLGLREIIVEQEARERSGSAAQKSAVSKHLSSAKKMSQKERKRLARESRETSVSESLGTSPPECSETSLPHTQLSGQGTKPKAWNTTQAWGVDTCIGIIQSFKDLMVSEERQSITSTVQQVVPPASQRKQTSTVQQVALPASQRKQTSTVQQVALPASQRKQTSTVQQVAPLAVQRPKTDLSLSWGLAVQLKAKPPEVSQTSPASPESPRENPWQPISSPVSPSNQSVSFTEIVKDEVRQTDTLKRAVNKPLALIQIEEEAKTALIQHYTSTCTVKDAKLSIERVQTQMATPTWAVKQSTHRK